jgi:hypothetical protein
MHVLGTVEAIPYGLPVFDSGSPIFSSLDRALKVGERAPQLIRDTTLRLGL